MAEDKQAPGEEAAARAPGGAPAKAGETTGIASVAKPGEPGHGGAPIHSNPPVPDAEEAEAGVDDMDEPGHGGPERAPKRPEEAYPGAIAQEAEPVASPPRPAAPSGPGVPAEPVAGEGKAERADKAGHKAKG